MTFPELLSEVFNQNFIQTPRSGFKLMLIAQVNFGFTV